jgi:hypothetical protein
MAKTLFVLFIATLVLMVANLACAVISIARGESALANLAGAAVDALFFVWLIDAGRREWRARRPVKSPKRKR